MAEGPTSGALYQLEFKLSNGDTVNAGTFVAPYGPKGDKGDKPVKGTDYFTQADKAEMVNAVLAALPTWTGGSY